MEGHFLLQEPILARICQNLTFDEAIELMIAYRLPILNCEVPIEDRDHQILTLSRVDDDMILLANLIKERGSKEALVNASFLGDLEVVLALLNVGADINAVNQNGNTPLLLAAQGNRLNIIRVLLDRGADINAPNQPTRDNNGLPQVAAPPFIVTPLMYASYNSTLEIVQELLERGANVNINFNGNTALSLAQLVERLDVVALLQQYGAQ